YAVCTRPLTVITPVPGVIRTRAEASFRRPTARVIVSVFFVAIEILLLNSETLHHLISMLVLWEHPIDSTTNNLCWILLKDMFQWLCFQSSWIKCVMMIIFLDKLISGKQHLCSVHNRNSSSS